MPLLDISAAQAGLRNYADVMQVRGFTHGSVLSNVSFTSGKRLGYTWRIFGIPNRSCEMEFVGVRRGGFVIKAVATLENRSFVRSEKGRDDLEFGVKGVRFSSEDEEDLEEREKLRRLRISKANKGNTPWNKGRKHSAETVRRIKERTRLAMQDPKVKMKLINQGHAQSEETKIKIAVGVRMGWERRRQRMRVQEMCHFEWKNLIAEASRRGFSGEEELQWDSYYLLDEQLEHIWIESVEQRKKTPRAVGGRRAPKSAEQRRKIAEAISAKWSDPDYRSRVCSALAKYHGIPEGAERKPKRIPRDPAQTRSRIAAKKTSKDVPSLSEGELKILSARAKLKRSNVPKYKDPLASSKLEMIKSIRAERAAADTKKTEAIERARLMIAEAEKAAKALEATALTNPHSMASLIETRKLINEAIQSIQSIDANLVPSLDSSAEPSSESSDELRSLVVKEMDTVKVKGINGAEVKINGTHVHMLTEKEVSPFSDDDDEDQVRSRISNGYAAAPLHINSSAAHFHFNKQAQQPTARQTLQSPNGALPQAKEHTAPSNPASNKKWVRGRLVEVQEEEDDEDEGYE
uniref:Nuclease associated modular domain-containing protein n=1 Tax=Kalanchoe fedtschenkoi TaxID=63787 RepID=A0A7N0TYS4_KALFE